MPPRGRPSDLPTCLSLCSPLRSRARRPARWLDCHLSLVVGRGQVLGQRRCRPRPHSSFGGATLSTAIKAHWHNVTLLNTQPCHRRLSAAGPTRCDPGGPCATSPKHCQSAARVAPTSPRPAGGDLELRAPATPGSPTASPGPANCDPGSGLASSGDQRPPRPGPAGCYPSVTLPTTTPSLSWSCLRRPSDPLWGTLAPATTVPPGGLPWAPEPNPTGRQGNRLRRSFRDRTLQGILRAENCLRFGSSMCCPRADEFRRPASTYSPFVAKVADLSRGRRLDISIGVCAEVLYTTSPVMQEPSCAGWRRRCQTGILASSWAFQLVGICVLGSRARPGP